MTPEATVISEKRRIQSVLISEGNGTFSREEITIALGEVLQVGHVLGRTIIEAAVIEQPKVGNVGGGTISTVEAGPNVKVGLYKIICTNKSQQGEFEVEDPQGISIGTAFTGDEFSDEIIFTLTDGSPNFAVNDAFYAYVSAIEIEWKEFNDNNQDGSAIPRGICLKNVDTTNVKKTSTAAVRGCEVIESGLVWYDGITDNDKRIALNYLSEIGIIPRKR